MSAVPSARSSWNIHSACDVDGDTVTLKLVGRVGSAGTPVARSFLEDAASRARHVRLDLGEVDYVSSAGIEVLRAAAAAIDAAGGTLTLVAVSAPVSVALKLAGEIPFLLVTTGS